MKVGDLLHASCSDEDYEIVNMGKDANGIDTLDLDVTGRMDEFIHWDYDENDEDREWPDFHGLTYFDVPKGTPIIMRNVQYKLRGQDFSPNGFTRKGRYHDTGQGVELNTPPGGCYRCSQMFWIYEKR